MIKLQIDCFKNRVEKLAVMLWEGDDKMEALALTDYLTGLPNRRGLYDFYHQLPAGETVSTMFLDIDNFKKVNDTYGHHVGDELLVGLVCGTHERG